MWPTGAPLILYLDVTKEELKDDFCSETLIRKRKQPSGAEPLTMTVQQKDVLLTGKISVTGHLADETRKALKAMMLVN